MDDTRTLKKEKPDFYLKHYVKCIYYIYPLPYCSNGFMFSLVL